MSQIKFVGYHCVAFMSHSDCAFLVKFVSNEFLLGINLMDILRFSTLFCFGIFLKELTITKRNGEIFSDIREFFYDLKSCALNMVCLESMT